MVIGMNGILEVFRVIGIYGILEVFRDSKGFEFCWYMLRRDSTRRSNVETDVVMKELYLITLSAQSTQQILRLKKA